MFRFQTPLHQAAGNGKGDVLEILLRNGANINEKDVRISSFEKQIAEKGESEERETGKESVGIIPFLC
jgi:hypothetical protein